MKTIRSDFCIRIHPVLLKFRCNVDKVIRYGAQSTNCQHHFTNAHTHTYTQAHCRTLDIKDYRCLNRHSRTSERRLAREREVTEVLGCAGMGMRQGKKVNAIAIITSSKFRCCVFVSFYISFFDCAKLF